ncbi:MAG: pantoate--beta-alanine ligase [Verrucomicrobia bacterium]|nr:MAG: pantoate--beta-alanine ligase [Verrucomicrobiota bacterium]
MTVVTQASELTAALGNAGQPRVLVPTMGALHHGHLALIRHAKILAGAQGTVVVSIFVNPMQFDRAGDLAAYPRPREADLAACRAAGVAVVFAPEAAAMYAPDHSVTVSESQLSRNLCGAARPGHFDGVCTVVLKLFLLCSCQIAVFGEKDFQQLAVIRRMVRDLNVPVVIVAHPTVRETNGLAMSSRNARLNAAQRADAPRLRRALLAAQAAFQAGTRRPAELLTMARQAIEASGLARMDYLSLVDADSLESVEHVEGPALLATAVFYGEVRLIDHVCLVP